MSLGPVPSGRLRNTREVDKLLSLRPCLAVKGVSVSGIFACICAVGVGQRPPGDLQSRRHCTEN